MLLGGKGGSIGYAMANGTGVLSKHKYNSIKASQQGVSPIPEYSPSSVCSSNSANAATTH